MKDCDIVRQLKELNNILMKQRDDAITERDKNKEVIKLLYRSLCAYMDHAPDNIISMAYDPNTAINKAADIIFESK